MAAWVNVPGLGRARQMGRRHPDCLAQGQSQHLCRCQGQIHRWFPCQRLCLRWLQPGVWGSWQSFATMWPPQVLQAAPRLESVDGVRIHCRKAMRPDLSPVFPLVRPERQTRQPQAWSAWTVR